MTARQTTCHCSHTAGSQSQLITTLFHVLNFHILEIKTKQQLFLSLFEHEADETPVFLSR